MSRYAIISDIHGNLHALQAVLMQIGRLELPEVICLGDIVGYGPFPDSCIDLVVKHCSVTVLGNHDRAVVDPRYADEFNGPAREVIDWTRRVLGPLHMNALCRLRETDCPNDAVTCVHGSPVSGPNDYVYDPHVAADAFSGFSTQICLLGHTHVPLVFEATCDAGQEPEARDVVGHLPQDGVPIRLEADRRYICNPGSVGQPRDADPRAAFAVLDLDEGTFTVHRQEYDIASAQLATQRAGLPTILAERLALGA